MARNRRRVPARRKKQRRWLIPKILVVLACTALIAFIGVILFMEKKLQHIGVFGPARAPVREMVKPERAQAPPPVSEELTPEERKRLDDIVRERSQK